MLITSSRSSQARRAILEVLDVLNERLVTDRHAPIAFDSDCREGICGMCGLMTIKDLVVDRGAFDRIIAAGGFISTNARGNP